MKVSAQNVALQYDELASAVLRGEEVEIGFVDRPAIRLMPALEQHAVKKPISELFGLFEGKCGYLPTSTHRG